MKPEQLTAWALNELSPEDRAQVELALSASPQAQETAHEVKAFCELLNKELGQDEDTLSADQREHLRGLVPAQPAPALHVLGSPRMRSLRSGGTTAPDWKQDWKVRVAAMAACSLMVGVIIYRTTQTQQGLVADAPAPTSPTLAAEDVRVSVATAAPKPSPTPSRTLEPKREGSGLVQNMVPQVRPLPMPDPVAHADGTLTAAVPSPSAVKATVQVPTGTTVLPRSGFVETAQLPVAVVNLEVNPIPLADVQRALASGDTAGLRVRTSDLINSFAYGYEPPHADEAEPVRLMATTVAAPWESSHQLVRVAMQARLGTEEIVARDVRLEVVFDSTQVRAYRVLGFERLAPSDAGLGTQGVTMKAGQAFTALFELIPAKEALPKDQLLADGASGVSPGQIARPIPRDSTSAAKLPANRASTTRVRMHFQKPESATGEVVELMVPPAVGALEAADADFQFATALAGMGLLMGTPDGQEAVSWNLVRQWAARGEGGRGERADLLKALNGFAAPKRP